MLQFQIVVNTLKITDGSNTVFSISKKDVYYIQTSLNENVQIISLYNLNVGVFAVVFKELLSDCLDPNGNPFTVNSFTTFAENNLGFNQDGASSTISVTNSYATLPNPTTVSGQFYWCENTDGTFPVGLYYSDGTSWQFQDANNITVVANYSALPNPTTVSGQFFWAEASQGTAWLPNNVGGNYYSAGMYYSNGVSYSFIDVPYQATQDEVNTGTNTNKFVTSNTLKNQNYLAKLESPIFTGTPNAPTPTANDNSTKIATTSYADAKVTDAITNGVTTIAPSQNAVFDALALKQAVLTYSPFKSIQTSQTAITGTVAETVAFTATSPAGAFNSTDIIKCLFGVNKTTALATYTLRLRVNTTNTISGAPTIAVYNGSASSQANVVMRNYNLNGGNLYGVQFATTSITDIFAGTALSSTPLNPANQFFIFATIQLSNASDNIIGNMFYISN
jgi:hypothetical protein